VGLVEILFWEGACLIWLQTSILLYLLQFFTDLDGFFTHNFVKIALTISEVDMDYKDQNSMGK
jgi:hypothetical protein